MSKKILVIEDEPGILDNIVETLKLEGFNVHGAANGEAGVHTARVFLPDMIICDIMMPGLNGYGVLMEIRSDPTMSKIPFMFLTARAERGDMRKGMELGADDYLVKPFNTPELLSAVQARLNRQTTIAAPYTRRMEDLRSNIVRALPHEIRTPLTGIIGYTEIMLMDFDEANFDHLRAMTEVVYKSGLRLHRVLENFLTYAQVEILFNDPERIRSLREKITDAFEVIPTHAIAKAAEHNRDADLKVQVADVNVHIERENLGKIVDELVDNACKFSEVGTPVEVTAVASDDSLTLTVTDRGRGMTPEQIDSVGAYMQFERKLYEQQGLGLGLIIALRLAQLHGGELSIESIPWEKTTVTVKLPR